jgi:DNA-methyltransferase (dcm)
MTRPDAGTREVGGSDLDFLRGRDRPGPGHGPAVGVVDLFAGCGGLSLGVSSALADSGMRAEIRAAVDMDKGAMGVYAANFPGAATRVAGVEALLPASVTDPRSAFEDAMAASGRPGLLVGGPPCQGHSDLNNHTRRNDPRNLLYLYMARAASTLLPDAVLVENVQGSAYDTHGVARQTAAILSDAGYHVDACLVDTTEIGVAQARKRYIVLGTRRKVAPVSELLRPYRTGPRDLRWAIGDLEDRTGASIDETVARLSPVNAARVDYLFDHGLHDLPDHQRPACHRDKAHSYTSVYGRLHWDRPSPTITSGFYSVGQGRYVHPSRRRTLTAREAARIQFFPDWFDFSAAPGRMALAAMIGNAVPMKLSYAITRALVEAGAIRPA